MAKQRKRIKKGTVLRTRDKYLPGGESSPHEKDYPNRKDLYRRVFIVESNVEGNLAIIEVQSKGVLIP